MILYTYNNITIRRFGEIQKDSEKIIAFKIGFIDKLFDKHFPEKRHLLIKNRINKIVEKHNNNNDIDKVSNLLFSKYHAQNIADRIRMYECMFKALENTWFLGIDDSVKDALELFKKYFNKDFEYADLEKIAKRINKLNSKYKIVKAQLDQPNNGFNFGYYIANIELGLDKEIKDDKLKNLKMHEQDFILREKVKKDKHA
jgi:hypothetical protein